MEKDYQNKITRVTTLSEVEEFINLSENIKNVVILPLAAGDMGDLDSDLEFSVENGEHEMNQLVNLK
ncbi:hypothetical protein A3Q56_08402 [Intoshia linei]|uniref:Uncharacterized protein n=1 Tax=Intoshia linei TaxID=1819745 RepID=A0A177APE9_9BILA|nr:hypothetical protein A3Q56_08402 [Intoshia linei]